MNIVQQELSNGTEPSRIGYFSFTRKAATEARDRAIEKFPELRPEVDFPWFRTLHSLAYRCLGINQKDMMSAENYNEFAKEAGIQIGLLGDGDEFLVQTDNPVLNEINVARIKGLDLRTHYNQSSMRVEWFHFEYVERAYRHYRDSRNLIDFTDLLELAVQSKDRLPYLDVLIIDEAQDLSRLQWKLVETLISKAGKTYIAGDDQQAVYTWAGADVDSFLTHEGETIVLSQSWRVPRRVHEIASEVGKRIRNKQDKTWNPRDSEGEVQYYTDWHNVDVSRGEWLVLAAANYMLSGMYDWLKSQGLLFERHGQRSISDEILTAVLGWETLRKGQKVSFSTAKTIYKYLSPDFLLKGHRGLRTADQDSMFDMACLREHHGLTTDVIWHEALSKISEDRRRYIIALLRRGIRLTDRAPIRLSTIHGAKGGEADNVLLLSDLTTKFALDYERDSDSVNRLLYVGVTRARQSLHIVMPKNVQKGFRL